MNLADKLLTDARSLYGNDHVLSYYRGIDYRVEDYISLTNHIKEQLSQLKAAKNRPVLILTDDRPSSISIFLACISYGLVPIYTSDKTSVETIRKLNDLAKLYAVFSDSEAVIDRIDIEINKCLYNSDGKLFFNTPFFDDSMGGFIDSETIAYLGLTSGSTGIPKMVEHRHFEMPFSNDNYASATLKITSGDVIYSVPKMSFTFGLANSLFFSFSTGARAILCDTKFDAEECLNQIKQHKVNFFFAVPSVYKLLLEQIEHTKDKELFSSVKRFVSAGEYLDPELNREWFSLVGEYIIDSVGCSEVGTTFLVNLAGKNKIGSGGMPVPGYHISLLDSEGNQAQEGVLYIDSGSNALGYYNNEAATNEKFIGNLVKTGDVFRVDGDGYYWFIGREDNMFKHHGMWVSPEEIASRIKAYPDVREAVVYKSGNGYNDYLAAAVVTHSGTLDTQALSRYLHSHLDSYKCPSLIFSVSEIPLNSNGKTDIIALKKLEKTIGE